MISLKTIRNACLAALLVSALFASREAAALLTIEQLQADAEVLFDATIYQRPSKEGEKLGHLVGGTRIRVTGHVKGTEWFRVSTDEIRIGYMMQEALRALDEAGAAAGLPSGAGAVQQASLVQVIEGEAFRDCDYCPEMLALPAGSYTMGNNSGDMSERPAHRVTLAQGFALGKYEVTVAEWMACVEDGGCGHAPKDVAAPERTAMRNVSWQDAQQYVTWLSRKTGRSYRLPSEAEWEYAARAGSHQAFSWGDEAGQRKADCKDCGGDWNKKTPAPIGSYDANGFGFHDMNGGVAEWTADCWFRTHKDAPDDGTVREEAGCSERVLRGGSWRDKTDAIHAAVRQPYEDNLPYVVNGFRVARAID